MINEAGHIRSHLVKSSWMCQSILPLISPVRKCSFSLHSLKGFLFYPSGAAVWAQMADDEILCALCTQWRESKRERAKESCIRKGGWVNYVLYWVIVIRHRNLSVENRTFFPTGLSLSVLRLYLIWHGIHTCVFDFISNRPLFRKCLFLFFILAYMELFNWICLSAAFYMLYHKNAFVLWISQHILNSELPRILSINVCLAEYINTLCSGL